MACIGDVYEIKNPVCGIEAEQGEADYGSDLGREVGVFDSRNPGRDSESGLRVGIRILRRLNTTSRLRSTPSSAIVFWPF